MNSKAKLTKWCPRCKKNIDRKDFKVRYRRGKKELHSYCKKCQANVSNMTYARQKEAAIVAGVPKVVSSDRFQTRREQQKMLKEFVSIHLDTHHCVDCGLSNKIVLEFDHVRGQKVANISQLQREGVHLDVMIEEMQKCEIRCSNCHKIKTAKEQGWKK